MTSERLAYLAGRDDAAKGLITLEQAAAEQGMGSFRAMYFMGAADELTNSKPEWRPQHWEKTGAPTYERWAGGPVVIPKKEESDGKVRHQPNRWRNQGRAHGGTRGRSGTRS